jgi:hypothetical protein
MSLLHELRSGERYIVRSGVAHRAKVARGPTSLEDLQEASGAGQGSGTDYKSSSLPVIEEGDGCKDGEVSSSQQPEDGNSLQITPSSPASFSFEPASIFLGHRPGFLFKLGPKGLGYYSDAMQSGPGSAANENHEVKDRPREDQPSTASSEPKTIPSSSTDSEEARMRSEELVLDEAAWERISSRVRLTLSTGGDLNKAITGRAKMKGIFDVITLGCRHLHLAGPKYLLHEVSSHAWMRRDLKWL